MRGKVIVWAVTALLASLVSQSFGKFTKAEKQEILDSHNEHRRKAGSSDMLEMKWDYKLERISSSYAAKCTWEHNPKRGPAGENLFVSTGTIAAKTAVVSWFSEIAFYDYNTTNCIPGKICGHYTQVMWANSEKLSCAKQFCAKMKKLAFKRSNYVVCNYLPGGNYRGVNPFKKGSACSSCPENYKCSNLLCTGAGNSIVITEGKLGTLSSVLTLIVFASF